MLLPCIICSKDLKPAIPPDIDDVSNQPYAGTVFTSHGHYGSTLFDEMGREHIEITICDDCLAIAAENNQVLHYSVASYERPVYEIRLWKVPKLEPAPE